jgi:hypothetical protein
LIVALVACSSPPRAPLAHHAATGPLPVACAVAPRRTELSISPYRSLGEIDGRTWFHVTPRDEPNTSELVTLDDNGRLAVTPVSKDSRVEIATTNDRAWIEIKHQAGLVAGSEELATADLATTSPRIERVESLRAKTTFGVDTFAIGKTRALFYTGASASPTAWIGIGGLEYWDRVDHRSLATVHGEPEATPVVRCIRDRCFAIGRFNDELQRVGFDAANHVVRTTLVASPAEIFTIDDADRTAVIYALRGKPGVFGQVIDDGGSTIRGETTLVPAQAIEPRVVGHHLLWWRDGWYVATVSADLHAGTPRFLGLDNAELDLAETTDGVLITAADSVDRAGQPPRAVAIFVPESGPPEPPVDIAFGHRSSGYVAFPIVAPGYAAAFVERMLSPEPGQLVVLRAPCH